MVTASELELNLLPAPDDAATKSPAYQADLRLFKETLDAHGLEVGFTLELRESADPDFLGFIVSTPPTYLGAFTIKLTSILGPPLVAGIAGWLHGRAGRKVRLKIGEIEVEAPTMKEVDQLISHALEIQQRTRPKVIHEP